MELLWPGTDPGRSAHGLQVVLSDLRKALGASARGAAAGAFICRMGDVYSLDVGQAGWVDVEAFEAGVEAGRRAESAGDVHAAVRHLLAAESLYTGDFLVDEQFSDWAAARRERVRDQYVDILLRLLRHYQASGHAGLAAEYARRALAADPYIEPCYRHLMRYSAEQGDQAGVARAYSRCQHAIREGFDSEVSAETRSLAGSLLGFAAASSALSRDRRRMGSADVPVLVDRPQSKRLLTP